MRVISRFLDTTLDESAPDQRVKLFKELARLRASEPKRVEATFTTTRQGQSHAAERRGAARD